MIDTILKNEQDGKVCQQIDMGMLQEVIPTERLEELLDTYQMWEVRERKTNMIAIVYWLIALHLYPTLSQRRVYGKMVSGLRTAHDDVPEQIPHTSAFSYRRSQLGSEFLRGDSLRALPALRRTRKRPPKPSGKGCVCLACDWYRRVGP